MTLDEVLEKMREQNEAAFGEPHVGKLIAALKKCREQRNDWIYAQDEDQELLQILMGEK